MKRKLTEPQARLLRVLRDGGRVLLAPLRRDGQLYERDEYISFHRVHSATLAAALRRGWLAWDQRRSDLVLRIAPAGRAALAEHEKGGDG